MALKQCGIATFEKTANSWLCQTSHGPPSGPLKNSQPSLRRCGASGSSAPAGVLIARASDGDTCVIAAAPANFAPPASSCLRVSPPLSLNNDLYPPRETAYTNESNSRSPNPNPEPDRFRLIVKKWPSSCHTAFTVYTQMRQHWSYICRER